MRAERRFRELERLGIRAHYEDVLLDIQARDERDRNRAAAPLLKAEEADLLDTSDLSAEEAVREAIARVERRR